MALGLDASFFDKIQRTWQASSLDLMPVRRTTDSLIYGLGSVPVTNKNQWALRFVLFRYEAPQYLPPWEKYSGKVCI